MGSLYADGQIGQFRGKAESDILGDAILGGHFDIAEPAQTIQDALHQVSGAEAPAVTPTEVMPTNHSARNASASSIR